MSLIRFHDWASRLDRFLNANRERKFQYGKFDCAIFVADCVMEMTGVDIAVPLRGRYLSRIEALDLIVEVVGRKQHARSIQAIAETQAIAFGMPEIPILKAQRGDMMLIRRPGDYSLGLVAMNGQQILIAGRVGWGPIPIHKGLRAWRV